MAGTLRRSRAVVSATERAGSYACTPANARELRGLAVIASGELERS